MDHGPFSPLPEIGDRNAAIPKVGVQRTVGLESGEDRVRIEVGRQQRTGGGQLAIGLHDDRVQIRLSAEINDGLSAGTECAVEAAVTVTRNRASLK